MTEKSQHKWTVAEIAHEVHRLSRTFGALAALAPVLDELGDLDTARKSFRDSIERLRIDHDRLVTKNHELLHYHELKIRGLTDKHNEAVARDQASIVADRQKAAETISLANDQASDIIDRAKVKAQEIEADANFKAEQHRSKLEKKLSGLVQEITDKEAQLNRIVEELKDKERSHKHVSDALDRLRERFK